MVSSINMFNPPLFFFLFFFLVYSFIIIQAKKNYKRVAINHNNSKKKLIKIQHSYSNRVGTVVIDIFLLIFTYLAKKSKIKLKFSVFKFSTFMT